MNKFFKKIAKEKGDTHPESWDPCRPGLWHVDFPCPFGLGTKEIAVGPPCPTFEPHAVEALLKSHPIHTSQSTPSPPVKSSLPFHTTLATCKTPYSSCSSPFPNRAPHSCLTQSHLLTPGDNLQEAPG